MVHLSEQIARLVVSLLDAHLARWAGTISDNRPWSYRIWAGILTVKLSRWQRIRWNIDGDLDRLERALWWALAAWLPAGVAWVVYDTVQRY